MSWLCNVVTKPFFIANRSMGKCKTWRKVLSATKGGGGFCFAKHGGLMKEKNVSQLFMCIGIIYVTCLLLSNLIAGKMWAVTADVTLPAAVILFPITYILGDVFTEVYGFKKARFLIWLGFGCSFFAVLIYLLTIALPHPGYWENQDAYAIVMGTTPRVAVASFVGYLFGEFSNSMILSKLKVVTGGKKLWVRTILSTVVGEGFDSVIFIMISFWGTMDNAVVLKMILFQYLFKVCYEVIFTPLTYAVVKWIKKADGVDTFDMAVKYNVIGSTWRQILSSQEAARIWLRKTRRIA